MASIHTDRAFRKAASKGASAAYSYERWNALMAMPKRELAEIAVHLASLATGEYDPHSEATMQRLFEERDNLKAGGII
jgi:hypothetical protein